jgi:hypothetical protein
MKIQLTHIANGCHQPTLIPCQPMYVRPAHFNLPLCADRLTQPTASHHFDTRRPPLQGSTIYCMWPPISYSTVSAGSQQHTCSDVNLNKLPLPRSHASHSLSPSLAPSTFHASKLHAGSQHLYCKATKSARLAGRAHLETTVSQLSHKVQHTAAEPSHLQCIPVEEPRMLLSHWQCSVLHLMLVTRWQIQQPPPLRISTSCSTGNIASAHMSYRSTE